MKHISAGASPPLAAKPEAGTQDFVCSRQRLARGGYLPALRRRINRVERIYLDRLMQTRDANEGLAAFIAKRPPLWEHQ